MSSRVLRKLGLLRDTDFKEENEFSDEDFCGAGDDWENKCYSNRYESLYQSSNHDDSVEDKTSDYSSSPLKRLQLATKYKCKKSAKSRRRNKGHIFKTKNCIVPGEDEIDRSVREINELLGEIEIKPQPVKISVDKKPERVLQVLKNDLIQNNELKRIFGSKTIDVENFKKRGRGCIRSRWIFSAKKHWPLLGKSGISMRLLRLEGEVKHFAFEHGQHYRKMQLKFLKTLERASVDQLMDMVRDHPYHIDALVQLSDVLGSMGEARSAVIFIERALYCLENSFHSSFSLTSADCALDYRVQENRGFFIALFRHMENVARLACYKTALAFCKVLLSLDNQDPLAVILIVDFYALKAEEYSWFIRMFNHWCSSRELCLLPNISYSLALAYYHVGEVQKASAQLELSLVYFPGVLLPLMEKCAVKVCPELASCAHFSQAGLTQPNNLTQLEVLYVRRSNYLWKDRELLEWLDSMVWKVVARTRSEDQGLSDAALRRITVYTHVPPNVARHMYLSGYGNVGGTTASFAFDPLPPEDSINSYPMPGLSFSAMSRIRMFFQGFIHHMQATEAAETSETTEAGADPQAQRMQLLRGDTSIVVDVTTIPADFWALLNRMYGPRENT